MGMLSVFLLFALFNSNFMCLTFDLRMWTSICRIHKNALCTKMLFMCWSNGITFHTPPKQRKKNYELLILKNLKRTKTQAHTNTHKVTKWQFSARKRKVNEKKRQRQWNIVNFSRVGLSATNECYVYVRRYKLIFQFNKLISTIVKNVFFFSFCLFSVLFSFPEISFISAFCQHCVVACLRARSLRLILLTYHYECFVDIAHKYWHTQCMDGFTFQIYTAWFDIKIRRRWWYLRFHYKWRMVSNR